MMMKLEQNCIVRPTRSFQLFEKKTKTKTKRNKRKQTERNKKQN